jgi:hypothetical protein
MGRIWLRSLLALLLLLGSYCLATPVLADTGWAIRRSLPVSIPALYTGPSTPATYSVGTHRDILECDRCIIYRGNFESAGLPLGYYAIVWKSTHGSSHPWLAPASPVAVYINLVSHAFPVEFGDHSDMWIDVPIDPVPMTGSWATQRTMYREFVKYTVSSTATDMAVCPAKIAWGYFRLGDYGTTNLTYAMLCENPVTSWFDQDPANWLVLETVLSNDTCAGGTPGYAMCPP